MINPSDTIIAYLTDKDIRHHATSGGIGSGVVKELFKRGLIKSAISHIYNQENHRYTPIIIHKEEDYVVSGSIYHEINLIKFVSENIKNIKSPFACFALPCQVTPIKHILDKHNIESYIIELTCSSQQSFEATEFLIKNCNLTTEQILSIRYRGGGWPGGITITLKNGTSVFLDNNTSLWTQIFHSHLFIMPRCFFCSPTRNTGSDLILADPWMIDQPAKEKEGRSLCRVKTPKMSSLLSYMANDGLIACEKRSEDDFRYSQMGTIIRKNFNFRHPKITRFTRDLLRNKPYRKIVLSNIYFFKLHCFVYKTIFRVLHKVDYIFNR